MTVRASQVVAEVLVRGGGAAQRASQIVAEVLLRNGSLPLRASQLIAEILVWNHVVTTPSIYPTLPGLGFSVIKRPKTFTGSAVSGSGWNVGVGYSSYPLWEWDLTYDLLSDESPQYPTNDLKTLLGFFIAMNGDLNRFLFLDPDDNAVTGQGIGTGDGSTTTWTLVRSFGGSDGTGTEPVGYVNTGQAFNVYLNGVLQSASTYSVLTTTPVNQQLKFTTAPGSGVVITVDMSYYFYVHFQASSNEFEKFMNQLWSAKKITLESLRG
jgi:uncharacterized protein (TIGR02217 family)